MFEGRNDVHLDGRLHHDIDELAVILADILHHHVIHLHQAAIRLELFRLVFRNNEVARVGVRVHPAGMRGIHDSLDLVNRNVPRENRLLFAAIVDEPAVKTHEKESRFQEPVLLRQLLDARERPARSHHELMARIDHRADRAHVGIQNALVVGQERSVKVCEQDFHREQI